MKCFFPFSGGVFVVVRWLFYFRAYAYSQVDAGAVLRLCVTGLKAVPTVCSIPPVCPAWTIVGGRWRCDFSITKSDLRSNVLCVGWA